MADGSQRLFTFVLISLTSFPTSFACWYLILPLLPLAFPHFLYFTAGTSCSLWSEESVCIICTSFFISHLYFWLMHSLLIDFRCVIISDAHFSHSSKVAWAEQAPWTGWKEQSHFRAFCYSIYISIFISFHFLPELICVVMRIFIRAYLFLFINLHFSTSSFDPHVVIHHSLSLLCCCLVTSVDRSPLHSHSVISFCCSMASTLRPLSLASHVVVSIFTSVHFSHFVFLWWPSHLFTYALLNDISVLMSPFT